MSWLSAVPIIGRLFKDTTDIIKEVVVDKDEQNRLIYSLEKLGRQVERELYVKELETKTVPWVDALHKMGRQILNLVTIIAVVTLLLLNIEITPTIALILGGPNVAYQVIKGKGKG